jgi:predicted nucleic acid-binding protein
VSQIVVDASVALCWFAREAETTAANRLIRSRQDLIAPSFLLAEMANGLWEKTRRGEMAAELTGVAMKEIRRFIPEFVDLSELAALALELAREIDHSVYDCCAGPASRRALGDARSAACRKRGEKRALALGRTSC